MLAVYYSQAREGGKTDVDFTMVRNVRKPSGAMPGKVIYTDYTTISVAADEELAEKLRENKKELRIFRSSCFNMRVQY